MLQLFFPPSLSPLQVLVAILTLICVTSTVKFIYNVFFHPLREYPGPFLSRATRLIWAYHAFNGNIPYYVARLHERYGEVVRIAPDELSYRASQAWTDIYGHRTPNGLGNLPKETRTRPKEVNGVPSIITANDETHRRMRRLQSHMFSEKALAAQEPLVNGYVDKLISRLHEQARKPETSIVDIHLNVTAPQTESELTVGSYTTFDILGDLAFGDSFGCLSSDVLHPWIVNIFRSVKDDAFIRVSKHFPWPLESLIYAMRPKALGNARQEEFEFAARKARQRMAQGATDRADFIGYILKYNDEKGMTPDEIESNSSLLILAGSETTATFLSGITYNLLRAPDVLKKLTDLVRTTFTTESEINILSVQKLDYFTACLEEGLRMYPPIPSGLPRTTTAEGNIICSKYVPPGTTVSVQQWTTYHSPENFTDPELFVPERWMKEVPEKYKDDNKKVFRKPDLTFEGRAIKSAGCYKTHEFDLGEWRGLDGNSADNITNNRCENPWLPSILEVFDMENPRQTPYARKFMQDRIWARQFPPEFFKPTPPKICDIALQCKNRDTGNISILSVTKSSNGMPSFFTFQQGNDPRGATNDSSPLLGRFRAVPDSQRNANGRRSHRNSLLPNFTTGIGFGAAYGSVFGNGDGDDSEGDSDDEDLSAIRRFARTSRDLWLEPKQLAVGRVVDKWWSRWAALVFLPAGLAIAWCALPFPQYELPDDEDFDGLRILGHKTPGHGEAQVEINFWFFLFVYYGFYNVTALIWITKVFNIYSLNWWPQSLGFPFTISLIAAISIAVPIPVYYFPESRFLADHNTAWICWTFFTMAMPLLIAVSILLNHERHLGLRQSLSETQRIFTSSWWTGDPDTIAVRDRPRRPAIYPATYDPDSSIQVTGEVYAEVYLRTLPHNTIHTIIYVYSWVVTVHLLDALVGFILGGSEGQRVGSYPLGYFSLTYQTYVRALYARLRSPEQFIYLQILSSSFLIILAPLTISKPYHYILGLLSINNQPLPAYQKFCARNIFLRGIAENVSMLAFLGSILVLHYGSNKHLYPYFSFEFDETLPPSGPNHSPIGGGERYDLKLTIWASTITWACEMTAGWIVRRIIWHGWNVDVTGEAKADIGMLPELLPTGVVVMVHVLQNMLFSIWILDDLSAKPPIFDGDLRHNPFEKPQHHHLSIQPHDLRFSTNHLPPCTPITPRHPQKNGSIQTPTPPPQTHRLLQNLQRLPILVNSGRVLHFLHLAVDVFAEEELDEMGGTEDCAEISYIYAYKSISPSSIPLRYPACSNLTTDIASSTYVVVTAHMSKQYPEQMSAMFNLVFGASGVAGFLVNVWLVEWYLSATREEDERLRKYSEGRRRKAGLEVEGEKGEKES
ncbi:hypothetical protein G7Y89_g1609 [Cudoniella acicularis]|uniref:Cytochrome P450 n=1 Tax=Cudoniella acicularis TaxID=354080 RepID=A0A8H4RUX5_9HELO|nr:hypothetical protein G7Y89_g1609 [Cudoniella acicularis]